MPITINQPIDPADGSVSASRQNGADVRQKAKPWEVLGISRATWYRYGKPAHKGEYDDTRFDKDLEKGRCEPVAVLAEERAEEPRKRFNLFNIADVLIAESRKDRPISIRTYQRVHRVFNSELWPYAEHGIVSIAQADRLLGNPHALRHFLELQAERLARVQAVLNAVKLFEQERRNDVSAEAIAAYLNKPVAFVAEVLRLSRAVP